MLQKARGTGTIVLDSQSIQQDVRLQVKVTSVLLCDSLISSCFPCIHSCSLIRWPLGWFLILSSCPLLTLRVCWRAAQWGNIALKSFGLWLDGARKVVKTLEQVDETCCLTIMVYHLTIDSWCDSISLTEKLKLTSGCRDCESPCFWLSLNAIEKQFWYNEDSCCNAVFCVFLPICEHTSFHNMFHYFFFKYLLMFKQCGWKITVSGLNTGNGFRWELWVKSYTVM